MSTHLLLDALTVAGGSGCTGTLTASCIDDIGQPASTVGQPNPTVTLTSWRADWNSSSVPLPFVIVPGELPVLAAVFALGGGDSSAIPASLSCFALLLPATATPPPLSQSLDRVSPRDVLSSVSGAVVLINGSAAGVAFAGLTASAAHLGQALALYAECTWTPTGERVRLPPVPLSTAQLALDWMAPPSTVLGYTAFPLRLAVTTVTPATVVATTAVATAECEVLLVNATIRSSRLVADAWSLPLDGNAAGGTSIPTSVNVTLQAPSATQLYVQAACTVWGQVLATPPLRLTTASVEARILSALPTAFVASDASSPWPVEPPLVVAVVTRHDGAVVADVSCSVTASTPATDLVVVEGATLLRSITTDPHTGVVAVPRFVVQTSPITLAATVVVECQHLASGEAVAPLSLTIPATLLTLQPCALPARKAAVGDPLPAFSVGVAVTLPGGARTSPCTAATSPTQQPIALPSIVCTIALNASASTMNDTASVFLQHTAVVLSADSHVATFGAFTLVAPQGQTYGLSLTCAVGGLALPPPLAFAVEIDGCRAGQASVSITCVTCGGASFSLGGTGARCTGCPPAGATCNDGILTLLPNYFRPAAQAGQPLGPDTELHPCYNSEACTLTYANHSTIPTYGCATGYTGPLCGVCDAAANYARFGDACAVCWDPGASATFLGVVLIIVLALLTHMALFSEVYNSYPDDAIVLRIALGYLQGVGSLRVFIAGSTQAYASVMGWTEVVSASPLSVGALQCMLRMSYLTQYAGTVLLPVLAAGIVIVIFLVGTTARSVRCASTRRAAPPPPLMASPGTSAPRFVTTAMATNTSSGGGGGCSLDTAALKSKLRSWWSSKRHVSTLLFVLFLTYMPITSASLRVLDCIDPVAGIRYLRSNLAVECGVGQHAVATVLAYSVLVVVGIGFPAGLAWLLGTARKEQLLDAGFHATWGFLFDGYRAPTRKAIPLGGGNDSKLVTSSPPTVVDSGGTGSTPHDARYHRASALVADRLTQTWVVDGESRVWWEAVVLCRKAGVVLLAVLVTNPYLQCVGATLWFFGAILLQLKYAPYEQAKFNRLELATLTATFVTAVVSTALLQFNVDVATADLHPPDAMAPIEWAVTITLVVINLGTLAALGYLWLRVQWDRARVLWRALPLRRAAPSGAPPPAMATATHSVVQSAAPAPSGGDLDSGGGAGDGDVALTTLNPLRTGASTRRIKMAPVSTSIIGGSDGALVPHNTAAASPLHHGTADHRLTALASAAAAPQPGAAGSRAAVSAMVPTAVRARLALKLPATAAPPQTSAARAALAPSS